MLFKCCEYTWGKNKRINCREVLDIIICKLIYCTVSLAYNIGILYSSVNPSINVCKELVQL